MVNATLLFPDDFLWGTATSAHQVEGNNTNSDWWDWEQQPGAILDSSTSGRACNWWDNAEEDIALAREMGTNAHRMSVEWSRIEPEPGRFDKDALDRYRQILRAMRDRDIEPMVTLHHFSNPRWLVEKGDFGSNIVVDYFQRYTAAVVDALGDLVPKWVTINEPVVYLFMRYLDDKFPPPHKKGYAAGFTAVANMLRCHAAAYHTIKEHSPAAQVGLAHNMAVFEPKRPGNRLDRWWTGRINQIYNVAVWDALQDGKLRFPYGRGKIAHLAGTADFIGINYYTRFYLKFPPPAGFVERDWGPTAVVSDGDYGEVYPYGLYRLITSVVKYKKPIYITENGVPDRADSIRPGFIIDHLRQIWHAISWCYPVMGYYHWSLVDNFEWDRGWTQRFGLIELDPDTQLRTMRDSGRLYSEICHRRGVSSDMVARYAPQLFDLIFPTTAVAGEGAVRIAE